MRQRFLNALSFGAASVTLAFIVIAAFLSARTSFTSKILIYGVFFMVGAGICRKNVNLRTSPIAAILGFAVTSILYIIWGTFGFKFGASLAFALGSSLLLLSFVPEGAFDIVLTPFSYFGGFVIGNLLLSHLNLHDVEGALISISLSGVLGAFAAMMVAFLKLFLEESKRFGKRSL
ncbi:hypothetical protein [Palaeococcus sp. (in: euryarchaeotes)]